MAILCPFLLKEYESEFLRRENFSDIGHCTLHNMKYMI